MNVHGKKWMVLLAVTLFIVAFDQWTKMEVHGNFDLGESVTIVDGFFNLTYVRNPGAAFGILRDANADFRRVFFLSIPAIAILFIILFVRGLNENEKTELYSLSLICGGAIGNYIDRIRFGYVIDFLDFHWQGEYSYPAFNVADSAIVMGVVIMSLLMFKKKPSLEGAANAG
jgi:signal peptidase II